MFMNWFLQLKLGYIQSKQSLNQFLPLLLIVKLENSFDLRIQKLSALRCVEARWNLTQSGACYVKYNVTFRDVTGAHLFNKTGYNITRMRICNGLTYDNVSYVEMAVSFKSKTTIVTAKLQGKYSRGEIHLIYARKEV